MKQSSWTTEEKLNMRTTRGSQKAILHLAAHAAETRSFPSADHAPEMSDEPPVRPSGTPGIEQDRVLSRWHRRGRRKQDDTSWISNGTPLLFTAAHFTLCSGFNYGWIMWRRRVASSQGALKNFLMRVGQMLRIRPDLSKPLIQTKCCF